MNNPLLQTGDLPPSTRSGPSTSRRRWTCCWPRPTPRWNAWSAPTCRPTSTRCRPCFAVATERLSRAWRAVEHLTGVADTPELRAAHAENLPRITEFFTRQGADERLYAKYRAVAAGADAASLSPVRRKALANWLRDFKLGGADLRGAAKARYAAIQERLAELSRQFSEHVLDATDGYALYVPETDLAGVPADAIAVGARGRRGRRPRGLQAHAALPELPAGDADGPQPRAARDALPRLRHAGERIRARPSATTRR